MIAATAVAVQTVDQTHSHLGESIRCNFVDVTSKVATGAVVVPTNAQTRGRNSGVLGQRCALAEKTNVVRIRAAVFGLGVAHHIEVDHSSDVGGAVLVGLGQVLSTQQTLLFACKGCECNRGFRLVGCKDAG